MGNSFQNVYYGTEVSEGTEGTEVTELSSDFEVVNSVEGDLINQLTKKMRLIDELMMYYNTGNQEGPYHEYMLGSIVCVREPGDTRSTVYKKCSNLVMTLYDWPIDPLGLSEIKEDECEYDHHWAFN